MKRWPALDLRLPLATRGGEDAAGLFAAWLDDLAPTALTELDDHRADQLAWRVFFATGAARDAALDATGAAAGGAWPGLTAAPIDVDDEAWAERSQASLSAVRVGRVVVTPPWDAAAAAALARAAAEESAAAPIVVTIEPSMGFGTGHHESTRLCLAALQATPLAGCTVLDVGTGSGVLAIAAVRLGAARALAIDDDADALASAADNVALNGLDAAAVETRRVNLLDGALPAADVVLGNLTGALLRRTADTLAAAVAPGGRLIVSGFTEDERLAVEHAFAALRLDGAQSEHGWLALTFRAG